MKNQIKNIGRQSTSNEETPEYFGAKGALSLKNENIMRDINLLTHFCKLHHFINVAIIFLSCEKIHLLKRMSKLTPKSFMISNPRPNKTRPLQFMSVCNKLECMSLVGHFTLV